MMGGRKRRRKNGRRANTFNDSMRRGFRSGAGGGRVGYGHQGIWSKRVCLHVLLLRYQRRV